MALARIVGRERELAAVQRLETGDALVLTGGPGIGKTTLWEAGVAAARERGLQALVVRPSSAEAGLPFAALIDLCDGVALDALPAPQRGALDVALLRAEPDGEAPEPRAIALGLLTALRALAAEAPLLIAVDDVQWLDAPSADALVFAARRLQSEPVAFLLARRPGRRSALESALERSQQRLEVLPLSLGATRRLLAERLGLNVPRPLLRRIVDATLGNPLFALEVGRTLVEQGIPPTGDELPLPDAVEDLLGTRVARLADGPRRVLLALALSAGLRRDELTAIAGAGAVEDALDAGLLRVDGARVEVSHPLLAAAARKRSRPRERRELHRVLSGVVGDAQFRALHLALATEHPDEQLADALEAAAAAASRRGGREHALLLGEHALRLTPAPSPQHDRRLLVLAEHLERAGDAQRLTDLLTPALDLLPPGLLRARAWLLLGEGAGPKNVADLELHLDRALAESADEPAVRAYVLAKKAAITAATHVASLADAEAWGREALAIGEHQRVALYGLGWARAVAGHAIDDLCERSGAAADASSYIVASPERIAGQRHVWRGELDRARASLEHLMALADQRGELHSYALQRLHVCELELRIGDWSAAKRWLDEWAQSAEGELLMRPMYHRCRALLAAGMGEPEEAERWTQDAVARSEVTGSRWDWLESQRARGIAALLAHEPQRAVECLDAVWQHTEREGVDPGTFPAAPDLAEALVEVGRPDAADDVARRLRARDGHPWAQVSARRCGALGGLAGGSYDTAAAGELAGAAADYERLGLRFDHARSLLALGRAQRRHKQWGAAREALEAAVAAFDAQGAPGWARHTRAELERVGGRRARASGELTPSERDVVELAAAGLANKEIAGSLHLAVHTVEVHLSRAYAKLGVRSRSQLAAREAERVNP